MSRKISVIVLFAALGTLFSLQSSAQSGNTLPQIFGNKGYDENKIYQDENGTYRVETRERQVWVPEQETRGIFGTHREPGHYETVREQVKVYINRNQRNSRNGSNGGYYDQNGVYHPDPYGSSNGGYYDQNGVYHPGTYEGTNGKQPGWVGKHPHGMPPGQRKKMEKYRN